MPKKPVVLLITLVLVLCVATAGYAKQATPSKINTQVYNQVYQQIEEQLKQQLSGMFGPNVIRSLAEQLTQQIVAQLGGSNQTPAPGPNTDYQPKPVPTPKPKPKPEPDPAPIPAPKPEPTLPTAPEDQLTAEETRLLDLTNRARVEAGLSPFKVDMVENNYFGHISPLLGSPFDQMQRAAISYRTAGENIAGAPTADRAHTGLMNSPGHRANILNSSFTHIGIGVAKGSPYGLIFTQQFTG